jgi:hypothetical protein
MCSTKTMSWIMIPLILGFFLSSIFVRVQLDVATETVTINPTGTTGNALVVYHPGQSSFQKDVTSAFVEGLVGSGWTCDVTTASREAPGELGDYDLLVLGAPTYQWKPASPIRRYIARLGELDRMPTALVLTGGGSTARAASLFVEYVEEANGNVIEMLEIWQGAPNEGLHGISDPLEIATRAGAAVTGP